MVIETGKIYNENCMETMERMCKNSVDLVVADIPYSEVSKNERGRDKYKGGIRDIKKGDADNLLDDKYNYMEEISRIFSNAIYIFCGIEQVGDIYSYFDGEFITRQCIWSKPNPSPLNGQKNYLSSVENIVFVKQRSGKFNGHCKTAVFDYPSGSSELHPTQKPIELIAELIEDSTIEGDLVYDPFMGSGTTGLVAEKLNRQWVGSEISEEYCEIARDRIKQEQDQEKLF